MVNYAKHSIDEDDINSVIEVLKSENLTQGKKVEEFEKCLENYTGYNYATAVNSGTAALHCACLAVGISEGDEVIIPSITFVATANVVRYCGGIPVFCDVDENLLIDVVKASRLITSKTKAIIAVDLGGQCCDYYNLKSLCNQKNLFLISDACHSLGLITSFRLRKVADFVCYSFHPAKHITTGEGGMILTDSLYFSTRIKSYRNHGRWNNFDNQMINIGFNYRMADINAALGISQFKKLDSFLLKRNKIAKFYYTSLGNITVVKNSDYNMWHLYIIKVPHRIEFLKYMKDNDVNCQIHYKPIYEHPYYKNYQVNCPNTCYLKDDIVSLPIYPDLTFDLQSKIIKLVIEYVGVDNL